MGDDGEFSREPLTNQELAEVRRIIQSEARRRWLRQGALIWIKWLSAVPATLVSSYVLLQQIFGSHPK